MTVNHKDGNRLNNNVNNLEWLSIGDNIRYGFENNQWSNQKPVKLVDCSNNEQLNFKSRSSASRYLGRNVNYINRCVYKNRKYANSISGNKFLILED